MLYICIINSYIATVTEGISLRQHIGHTHPIVVLQGGENLDAIKAAAHDQLQLIVQTDHQLEGVLSSIWPCQLPVWLKCDTGMHRLGMSVEKMKRSIPLIQEKFGKDGYVICSHFVHRIA